MRRDSRRTSTVKQKMQRNRRQIQFVEILAINLTSRTPRSFFSEITNTWKESVGERIQGRKIQKAAGSFIGRSSLSRNGLCQIFCRPDRPEDWSTSGLGFFFFLFPQTSCCRIAPVHLWLDPTWTRQETHRDRG